jgi:hypothetical protein
MSTCIETFTELAADSQLAKKKSDIISERHPACVCEAGSVQPSWSPGRVENGEMLLRAIYSPHHIETDTGLLNPMAFDDVVDKGLSVERMSYSSSDAMAAQVKEKLALPRAQEKGHKFVGVVALECAVVRDIQDLANGSRLFAVYDTATSSNAAHADICQVRQGSKTARALARNRLIESRCNGNRPERDIAAIFTSNVTDKGEKL